MVVVHHSRSRVRFVQDHGEVDLERRVVRIGVVRPLEVSERAPVIAVVPALVDAGGEGLSNRVGHEQHDPAWRRMDGGRLDHGAEVGLRRHVHDRVVDENHVERATEPKRAHVTLDVLALRVDRRAQLEHLLREIGERAVEASLHV